MKVIKKFLILLVVFGGVLGIDELPKGFKKCKFGPDFNECMKIAINDALPKVVTGFKELGLPKLEPFIIKNLKIEQNQNSPVNIKQEFTNLEMPDFITNTMITDLQLNKDNREIMFVYNKTTLHMNGDYIMSGQVLILPIQGRGKCSIKFTGMELKQRLKYDELKQNDATYWHFTSVHTKMTPEKMETNFENLFNGNKELGDSTNKFINENWQDIYNELEPHYSAVFSSISLKILNKFFSQLPIEKIFLE